MKNPDRRTRRLAAVLGLMLALGGIAPAQAVQLEPQETAETEQESAAAETESAISEEPEEGDPGSAAVSGEAPKEVDSGSAEVFDPNLDYILGRPMTEEEIAEQKALEPDYLPIISMPEDLLGPEVDPEDLALSPSLYATLPASYDAREASDLITPVKNQLPYGSCWAFAALASGEASLIRRGAVVNGSVASASNLDLSELQLLYFFYHPKTDELGNTAGDSVSPLGKSYLWVGGHGIFTTFALSSWIGAAAESVLPYSMAAENLTLDSNLCRDVDVAHMQNAYWVLMSDRDGVKSLIREYGSVAVSFHWPTSGEMNGYNYSTGAYNNNNTDYAAVNHAVNVVGWDDNYSRDNFLDSVRPESDGAWLVKNNWGSDWGDEGYFWMSYEDVSLIGSTSFGYVYDFEAADNYDHIYQYDGSWSYNKLSVPNGKSVANLFTVSGSEKEELRAVSLSLFNANVEYSLQIYRDPPSGDPTGGTPMLEEPQEGWLPCAGYHTIELEQPGVRFLKGETFAVVFTLSTADDTGAQVMSDATGKNGNWVQFVNATEPGQSYINNSGSWVDLGMDTGGNALGTFGITVRVKAFTEDIPIPIEEVTLSETFLSLREGNTVELAAQILPENTTEDKEIRWNSSDPSVVTVENGRVTGVSVGTAVITAEVGEAGVTDSCTVQVLPPILIREVILSETSLELRVGDTAELTTQLLPEDTSEDKVVRWSSSNPSVVVVENGQLRAMSIGTAVITAAAGRGDITATCSVEVLPIPIEEVILSKTALCLQYGSTAELTAQILPENTTEDKEIRWNSSDPSVVTVENGRVTGVSVGTAVITAEVGEAGVTDSCTVQVLPPILIREVILSETSLDLEIGDTAELTARILPEDTTEDREIRWSSSKTSVVTVESGRLRAVKAGTAVITAEAGEDGVTASCTVEVREKGAPLRPVLRSMVRTGSGLKVRWNKVDCDGYRIYRKEPGGSWTGIANTEGSRETITFNDKTAQAGVTYIYTVRAYNYVNGARVLSNYDTEGVRMKK